MNRIPDELRDLNRWHCWALDAGTKIPVQVNGRPAKSNDPNTWTDFYSALTASKHFTGIAFELGDPYCGIDLDNCLDDKGMLRSWALPIVSRLDGVAYAEISPSGNGIKFITRARKTAGARCVCRFDDDKQQLEAYDRTRFWTITGNVYAGNTEIGEGQEVVNWICETYLTPKPEPVSVPTVSIPLTSDLHVRAGRYVDGATPAMKGDRNNAAFRLAGHLHAMVDDFGNRPDSSTVLNFVRLWNSRNPEPLPDSEIEQVVQSAAVNGTPREIKRPEIHIPEESSDVDLSGILGMGTKSGESSLGETLAPENVPAEFPAECLEVPGLIGELVSHNLRTAHYPLPELALAGALSLMSTLTGGKVTGLRARTNLYVVGLAPSGGGKDHSRKLNRQVLLQTGHSHMCGPERIGSHAGIVSALAENWNTLFQIDEIGRLLATMQNAQMSPHLYNIASVLMQLYSSADSIWQADAYGDRKKVKRLEYPHCVVYGSSVPDGFWEGLTKSNLTDGLIGRFLIFEEPEYVDYQDPADEDMPESVLTRALSWLELRNHEGNLAGTSSHEAAHPHVIEADEDAGDRLKQHAIDISLRRKREDPVRAAIWSRAAEKTNKLALLFAASRWTKDAEWPSVTLQDADLAVRLNNWLTRRLLDRAGLHVAENVSEQNLLRILRLIQSKDEWTKSELTRASRWLKARDRNDILTALEEGEQITKKEISTGGCPRLVYRSA